MTNQVHIGDWAILADGRRGFVRAIDKPLDSVPAMATLELKDGALIQVSLNTLTPSPSDTKSFIPH